MTFEGNSCSDSRVHLCVSKQRSKTISKFIHCEYVIVIFVFIDLVCTWSDLPGHLIYLTFNSLHPIRISL